MFPRRPRHRTPTPTPTPTDDNKIPVNGDANGNAIPITQDKDSGEVNIDLNKADAEKALEQAKVTGEVVIRVPKTSAIDENTPVSATISNNALKAIADSGAALTINAPSVSMTFDADVLGTLSRAGTGEIVITTGRADKKDLNEKQQAIVGDRPVYDFTVTVGNRVVSKLGGTVTVSLPYKPLPGRLTFNTDHFSLYMIAYNAVSFADVTGSHWAKNHITFVAARSIFNGTGEGQFTPDGAMTRAMFAVALSNLDGANLSVYRTSRFNDIAVGRWYSAAVEWAADKGIVSGVGGGRFDPNTEITREQMAVMLYNYMRYKGYTVPSGLAVTFNDEAAISAWAYGAVKAIQKMGIVSGKPGNLYDPQATATRAEVATIFTRFVKSVTGVTAPGSSTAANTPFAMLPGKENEFAAANENSGEKEA